MAMIAGPGTALADPEAAQAETLFRQGRDLMAAKKYAEACASFEASEKLDAAPTTLLNLADCRGQNGQLATAWGVFIEVGRKLRGQTDERSTALATVASSHAYKLEPRLSKLTIQVPAAHAIDGLEIRRNNDVVEPGAWNHALPIDGGTYAIVAHAPGRVEWTSKITLKPEGDNQTIAIPDLELAKVVPISNPNGGSARPSRTLQIALGVTAVALGGAAIGFHLWGNSTYDKSLASTDADDRTSLWHSANTKRYVAEGMSVAAIGCAGGAAWLWLRSSSGEAQVVGRRGTTVQPIAAAYRAGFVIAGWF